MLREKSRKLSSMISDRGIFAFRDAAEGIRVPRDDLVRRYGHHMTEGVSRPKRDYEQQQLPAHVNRQQLQISSLSKPGRCRDRSTIDCSPAVCRLRSCSIGPKGYSCVI